MAPTVQRAAMPEVGFVRFINGKRKEAWSFADGLGLLLRLDAVDEVLGQSAAHDETASRRTAG